MQDRLGTKFLESKWRVQGADTFSFHIHCPVAPKGLRASLHARPGQEMGSQQESLCQFDRSLLLNLDRGQNDLGSFLQMPVPAPGPNPTSQTGPSESDVRWGRGARALTLTENFPSRS